MSVYKFEPLENREGFACMLEGVAASVREGSVNELVLLTGNSDEGSELGQMSVFMPELSELEALRFMNDGHGALIELFTVRSEQEEDEDDD